VHFSNPASFISVVILVLANALCAAGEADSRLLSLVQKAHRASAESIRTLTCKIRVEEGRNKMETTATGEYWKSGDMIRVTELDRSGATDDLLVKGGEVLVLSRTPGADDPRVAVAAGRRSIRDPLCRTDVWERALMVFPGRQAARLSLDDFVKLCENQVTVQHSASKGGPSIRLAGEFTDPGVADCKVEVEFDLNCNYLVTKLVTEREAGGVRTRVEKEALSLAEPLPGIFFADKIKTTVLVDGKQVATALATITDLVINSKIPSNKFLLRIPPGTHLADRIQGKVFVVDASGRPAGPAIQSFYTKPQAATRIVTGYDREKQTAAEPSSPAFWIVVVSIGIIAMTGSVWAYRSYRRSI
jgi:hypothetical protein